MDSEKPLLLFNAGKKEVFSPGSGFKQLTRRLRSTWRVASLKEELTSERLEDARVLVFAGPRQKFTAGEFEVIRQYLENGGSLLIMVGEGGETRFDTNINFLLEEYGVMVNADAVVRSTFYKYHHPKECLVSNGVLNREINKAAGKPQPSGRADDTAFDQMSLQYLYPFGATLSVQPPAVPVLSTGNVSIPLNRPTCAFYSNDSRPGKLAVIGSCHIFSDQYLDKEENGTLLDVVLSWLTDDDFELNHIDAEEPEISEYVPIPHVQKLADKPRVCLQESDDVPRDFTTLFSGSLFGISTKHIPATVQAYADLDVAHEQLRLIEPQFEAPLPPLQPAVFPPTFREMGPPALDLFDLDESFSSEKVRLNQLANKCTEDDLEYFVRECGDIMGITHRLDKTKRDGKHILEYALKQLVKYKRSSMS
ncbi:CGI-53 protein [Salpingoeca rosetta]|uniref:CGI-53 protein n=1 Tax=Salpingoeca rosetta (strain ATCC 50818 / BSB-021) TaxID=946362 RepID=F2UMJ9_SALR5|nr:CGI-53 protein [Salpingoeca rosetta]EGD78348.1 CGI-53 protein [Salpingoeca rosetta]|eukprot:XP_004989671.1 CGI-53 protein [Salpingoeca rosetta]